MAANKVFIVEDDAVIARAVAAHLTTWQMQVQCAGNFEKITEEVEDFQPDIIIFIPFISRQYCRIRSDTSDPRPQTGTTTPRKRTDTSTPPPGY